MTTDSNILAKVISEEIAQQGGSISFARFMELSLYHPRYGYYNSERFNIGKQGDFTTASEISPLFARCFAVQCQQIADRLGSEHILELGAGTGRFAGELLLQLDHLKKLPKQYYIYEFSLLLREKQQAFLKSNYPSVFDRVVWLDALPENFKGIMIGNEVLDALPCHRFRIEEKGNKECRVGFHENQFVWMTSPLSKELQPKVQALKEIYELEEGYESEINLALPVFIKTLATSLTQGVILFSDYGYGQQEYYHPERINGTLTCFYQHRQNNNPFLHPGFQDITSHVDFTSVVETAVENGCNLMGFTTQASFLLNCGLIQFAEETETALTPADKVNHHHAIKLLTMPTEMGERVKIMALSKNITLQLRGFSSGDRRREL